MRGYCCKIRHNGHMIQYNDRTWDRAGVWTKPDGTTEPVEGTWAFTPGYSWWAVTSQKWVVLSGHWQL